MIAALVLLFGAQLAGEALVAALHVPVPGPVVGMVLMVALIAVRRGVPADVSTTANGLLGHLSLLFVPAGVGIMRYLDVIAREWLAIAVTIVASTCLTMIVTAATMRALRRAMRA